MTSDSASGDRGDVPWAHLTTKTSLESLRKKLHGLGFFPLPLSETDIECFWVCLEPKDPSKSSRIRVTHEELRWPAYVEALKEVSRYEEPKKTLGVKEL